MKAKDREFSLLMKKTKTKKETKAYYAMNRSKVALGFNTASMAFKSKKDYNRNKMKADIRKIFCEV